MTDDSLSAQESSQNKLEKLNLAIVGLARNCEKSIRADVYRIKAAAKHAKSIVWLIVESDSSDETIRELEKLEVEIENFHFSSLGQLINSIPKRTDRISYCRNYYAEQLRSNETFSNIDYVVVADFDGLNSKITQQGFESCWERNDWDMCAANQDGPYYDIWALRHKEWCPEDCWAQYKFLNTYRLDFEKNIWASVYSKMITIPQTSEWIEVDSAFGGFAIYKKRSFDDCEYVGITEMGDEFCEHVYFHRKLKARGARLYINPKLINAAITEHTIHLSLKNRVQRRLKSKLKQLIINTVGFDKAQRLINLILKNNG
jgi:hypothetical protein